MSQYLILIYGDEAQWAGATPDENAQLLKEHSEFAQRHANVMRGGNALQSTATATAIRPEPAGSTVTDGPFAETKEALAATTSSRRPIWTRPSLSPSRCRSGSAAWRSGPSGDVS